MYVPELPSPRTASLRPSMLCFLLCDQQGPLLDSVPSLSVASVPPVFRCPLPCVDPGLHGPDPELGAWPAASGTVRAGEGGAPGAGCVTRPPVTAWDSQRGLCHVCVPVFCCMRGEVSVLGSTACARFRSPGSTHLCLTWPLLRSVKRYIRKGVPLEHRARVWMGVSGAQAQMDRNPGYYQRLLQGEHDDRLEEAIRTGEPARQGCGWAAPRDSQVPEETRVVREAPAALKWKFLFF